MKIFIRVLLIRVVPDGNWSVDNGIEQKSIYTWEANGYMRAMIIFTGQRFQEHMESQNTVFMLRELATLGIQAEISASNLSDPKDLSKNFAQAIKNCDIVMIIGGLGEGYAQNAKDIVCGGLGLRMVVHPSSYQKLEKICQQNNQAMSQQDLRYVTVPVGAEVFSDENYAIPGFAVESGGQAVLMLPDNDDMHVDLYMDQVFPYLADGSGGRVYQQTIRLFGLTEKQARKAISDLIMQEYPSVSIFTRGGGAEYIHIVAEGGNGEKAVRKMADAIHQRFGNLVAEMDINLLPGRVVQFLKEQEYTIAIAETITEGLLEKNLQRVPSGEEVIDNAVNSLLNNVKQRDMNVPKEIIKNYPDASEEMAISMAAGILETGNATIGIAVCGGMASDNRGGFNSTAFVALATDQGVNAERIDLIDLSVARDQVLGIVTICALQALYRFLNNLPHSVHGLTSLKTMRPKDIEYAVERIRQKKNLINLYTGQDEGEPEMLPEEDYREEEALTSDLANTGADADREIDGADEAKMAFAYQDHPDTRDGAVPMNEYDYAEPAYMPPPDAFPAFGSQQEEAVLEQEGIDHYREGPAGEDADRYRIFQEYAAQSQSQDGDVMMEPSKTKTRPRDIVMRVVLVLTILVLLAAVFFGVQYVLKSQKEDGVLNLSSLYWQAGEVKLPNGYPTTFQPEFSQLYSINPDVKGVINIPGTPIDYPVVQAPDNHTYTSLDFYKRSSVSGTPYLDARSNLMKSQSNILIYANNTQDGEMFSQLTQYGDLEYYQEHPSIIFNTVYDRGEYKVFAAFYVDTSEESQDYYNFGDYVEAVLEDTFLDVAYDAQQRSVVKTPVIANYGDELLMLSTTADAFEGAGFVVLARKVRENEEAAVMVERAVLNAQPLYPDAWYAVYGGEKPDVEGKPKDQDDADKPRIQTLIAGGTSIPDEVDEPEPAKPAPSSSVNQAAEEPSSQELSSQESSSQESSSEPPSSSKAESQSAGPSSPEWNNAEIEVNEGSSSSSSGNNNSSSGIVTDTGNNGGNTGNASNGQTLTVSTGSGVVTASAHDIICQVVEAEMGNGFPTEALKAQAVAAYTYILYESRNGGAPYVPTRTPSTAVKNAVAEVLGQTIYYNGQIAYTPYFAMSAGQTQSSAEVWGGSIPYLVSVDSSVDMEAASYMVSKTYTESEIVALCQDKMGFTPQGDPSTWFNVISYTSGGYNDKMSVGGYTTTASGRTITGRYLREGVLSLRSSAFDVAYAGGVFTFTTKGYGHGVGLSQWGAYGYARQGYDYRWILQHYYPGVSIQ